MPRLRHPVTKRRASAASSVLFFAALGPAASAEDPVLPVEEKLIAPCCSTARAAERVIRAAGVPAKMLEPSPPVVRRFDGLDRSTAAHQGTGSSPSDAALAVSRFLVLEAANSALRLSDKIGQDPLVVSLNDFFGEEYPPRFSQPKVAFDREADRFFVAALALDTDARTSAVHLAVSHGTDSRSLDLSQNWCRYRVDVRFNAGDPAFAGSLGLGYNGSWITLTSDNFKYRNGAFRVASLYAFDKTPFVRRNPRDPCPDLRLFRFNMVNDGAGQRALAVQPALHVTHSGLRRDPLFLVSSQTTVESSNRYALWRLETAGEGEKPTLSRTRLDAARSYGPPPGAPQRDGPDLDTGDARITQAVFRDGRLWAVHATVCGRGPAPSETCVRLLEIVPVNEGAALRAPLDLGRRDLHLWAPSLAVNGASDVLVAFQRARDRQFFGVGYAVKSAGSDDFDSLRNLTGGQCTLVNFDDESRNRTGAIGAHVDAFDDLGLWVAGEYPGFVDGVGCDWRTRIGQVRRARPDDPARPGLLAGGSFELPTTGTVGVGNTTDVVSFAAAVAADVQATAGQRLHFSLRDASRPFVECGVFMHPLSGCATIDYPINNSQSEASFLTLALAGGSRTYYVVLDLDLADQPDPAAPE